MEAIPLPAKWQEWEIVEVIGEGSFGTVYRAEKDDGVVKSVSAIKVVEIAADDGRMAGLSRRYRSEEAVREYLWSVVDHCAEEIRTMYRLQGESSIVSIQDHAIEELEDRVGWRLFIRMEYLQSFDDYLTTHEFTQRDIIRMGISLCGALEKCEKLNILHRDIKPGNIFVSSSGEFKLGDFGISRVLEETRASLTSEGTIGTMAPEVYKGQPCGKEADIYSLGLVLYVLANKNCEPFVDTEKPIPSYGELQDAFDRRMKGEPLPPPVEASPALSKVLLKACACKPSARYRSAAEFRAALEPLAKEKRRLPIRWGALIAAMALLAAGVAWILPRLAGNVPATPEAVSAPDRTQAAIASASPIPGGFAPMDAKDGNWVRYVLNGGDAVLSYRAPTNNPNDAANFDRDADMLLGFLLENSGEQVSGEPAQAQVEETVDGARIAFTEFACADGRQGSAAMIFDPVGGVLHGVVMTVAGGIDSGTAPDFPAFVRSLNTADIDSLFAPPEG